MRKKRIYKKNREVDLKHQSFLINKFMNNIMLGGNKATVEKFTYLALENVAKELNMESKDINTIFEKTLNNVVITHDLRSRRVGGATYQVPKPLDKERMIGKTIKFLVKHIRASKAKSLDESIKNIILDAYKQTGSIYSAYISNNNAIESNRVNSVYRW